MFLNAVVYVGVMLVVEVYAWLFVAVLVRRMRCLRQGTIHIAVDGFRLYCMLSACRAGKWAITGSSPVLGRMADTRLIGEGRAQSGLWRRCWVKRSRDDAVNAVSTD